MTKGELMNAVAEKCGKPKYICDLVINTMIDTIVETLKYNDDLVRITGLCTLEVKERKERKGYSIEGEETVFPAKKYVKIKPSEAIKRIFDER